MGSFDTKDPLRQMGEKVSDYCKKQSLQVFYGFVGDSEDRHVYWNAEDDSNWTSFLEIAKSLDVKLIYLDLTPFEDSQVVEALETNDEDKRKIESFRSKVGFLACIDVAFLYGNVFHTFQSQADWFKEFSELTDKKEGDGESEEVVDIAIVNEWANKLAADSRYATCKNKSQRKYLLEELAGDEFDELPEWDILETAEKVYFLKVKPKEDQRLKKEAMKLRDQGITLNAIAQKLGISRDRVSGLLAD
jgi:hypothetical protein